VITGAGTGIGRELARQLASEGCHLALCDVLMENLDEARAACAELAPTGTLISAHECDVSDESQVIAFCDAVRKQHRTEQINLLFNNAGIAFGGSFVLDDRADWDRTFGVDWFGVYYCTRAFMPLLLAGTEGHIVNVSSVNGFWATTGPNAPITAYASAKFAVKGFSEALVTDLRLHAPHVKVSVVMPGHIGTALVINSRTVHGRPDPEAMTPEEFAQMRENMRRRGVKADNLSDEELKTLIKEQGEDFRDNAPFSAAKAATVILDGVRKEQWRILVGDDAHVLDRLVRESPDQAYERPFYDNLLKKTGWRLGGDR
jgi:NAD(P)-dependent dehydrogenase (short-subunit alcohol dehydrogenase family)